ncbi:MAG: hypothetical protein J6K21_04135 [Bacilli bacterium]|nr:hypothetical protein [Bacilli bacterium]
MDRIDKELKAMRKFYEYVTNNIYYTRHNYKIGDEIKISTAFPIYLRNPNELELEYFRNKLFEKIFSILSIFSNAYGLKKIINSTHFDIYELYSGFSSQIYDIQNIYNEYIKVNNDKYIKEAIEKNDVKSFSLYLSSFINEDIVLLEIKDWKRIDKAIHKYFNCSFEDILDYDYREYFIEKYINLFNIVNFDLTIYKGLTLSDDEFFMFSYVRIDEYDKIFEKVLFSPYSIDQFVEKDDDLLHLMFLINSFDKEKYMRERKYSVDFVSCLEFFLVKKLDGDNSKIQNQIRLKVRRCCKELGYSISNNEIKDLYDYRCFVVHGNFDGLNRKVNKIINKEWYKEHLNKLYSGDDNTVRDNNEKEELIYCRLYEIFNIVFKLYCEKKKKIEKLKEITSKEKIEEFKF